MHSLKTCHFFQFSVQSKLAIKASFFFLLFFFSFINNRFLCCSDMLMLEYKYEETLKRSRSLVISQSLKQECSSVPPVYIIFLIATLIHVWFSNSVVVFRNELIDLVSVLSEGAACRRSYKYTKPGRIMISKLTRVCQVHESQSNLHDILTDLNKSSK